MLFREKLHKRSILVSRTKILFMTEKLLTITARWQPATRDEWAYPDSPYPTQAPAYQAAPTDNYQAPAANYQAPADNTNYPPAAQESYTAPAYKK